MEKTELEKSIEDGIKKEAPKYTAVITTIEVMKSMGVEDYDARGIYRDLKKEFGDITLEEVEKIIDEYKSGRI